MCLSVLVCDYECIRFRLCCFVYLCAEFRHTLTHWIMMCVCLVHSMSGLCPLGRPCVARFCGNRFWQLCNFCWFIPDLGKLFFCSAGVVCKAHTHTHTRRNTNTSIYCIYIYTQESNKKNRNDNWIMHPPHIYTRTSSHSYIHPQHPSSTQIHAHIWC